MSAHLQEMMEDGEALGWSVVRAYNTVWLQHLEQGRATWNDEVTRLKLRRTLVWHRMAPSSQPSTTPATTTPQAPTRAPRCTGSFRLTAQPGDQACISNNQELCTSNTAHSADLHVCSFLLQATHRLCQHSELNCKHKALQIKCAERGGGAQEIDHHRPWDDLSNTCQTLHKAIRVEVVPLKLQLS